MRISPWPVETAWRILQVPTVSRFVPEGAARACRFRRPIGVYFEGPAGLIDCMARRPFSQARRLALTAGFLVLALPGLTAQKPAPPESDRATIEHVLNRLGFGPRPGDVERVKVMGVATYIDTQLHPERVDDSVLDARLAGFETLKMSTQELAEKYFRPAEQARRAAQVAQARQPEQGQRQDAGRPAQPEMMGPDGPTPAPNGQPRPMRSPEVGDAALGQRTAMNEFMQAKVL